MGSKGSLSHQLQPEAPPVATLNLLALINEEVGVSPNDDAGQKSVSGKFGAANRGACARLTQRGEADQNPLRRQLGKCSNME